MEKQTYDDQLILQYLLGRLSDEEVDRLDCLDFEDDQFSQRLQAVEDDLIDAFVNDELSGQELERFNSHYLLTPRRREKLVFARAFQQLRHSSGAAARSEKKPSDWRRVWREPLQLWGLAAAAVLLLLAGIWLVSDNFRLRNRLQQTRADLNTSNPREQELRSQLERQRSANSAIADELKNIKDQLALLKRRQAEPQKQSQNRDPGDLSIAHFDLAPQLRSIGRTGDTISIPPGTDYVSFKLKLEPGENGIYRAELKPQGGNQAIWKSGKLQTRSSDDARVTELRIPASLLAPGWYILELSALSSRAGVEIGYTFRVENK